MLYTYFPKLIPLYYMQPHKIHIHCATYQETSLTKWSLRAIPAPASKVEEWVSLLKSQDTTLEEEVYIK